MSASVDDNIPNVVHGIHGDGDDDEEEEDDAATIEKLQRRRRGFDKAKEVVLHPFTKAKNKIRRIRSRRALLRSPSSSFSGNASSSRGSSGKVIVRGDGNRTENGTVNRNGNGSCNFCFSRPRVLESGDDSSPTTSDPNNPKFTHTMLRDLLENNDFYSKECNPHVD